MDSNTGNQTFSTDGLVILGISSIVLLVGLAFAVIYKKRS